ncbi:MAG: ABC transporter substrate-binding protein [Emcibacter sp.]|nr:ABC transporter substrate-binding protein [Emcibacter sp.]
MIYTAATLLKTLLLSAMAFFLAPSLLLSGFLLFGLSGIFSGISSDISYAQDKPQAVSLDYCADQFILSLADRDQIMAVTHDATRSHSFYSDKAQGLPQFGATSEEVLHMMPDVVIRSWGGSRMLPLLQRAKIPVTTAIYGTGPEILYQNMRAIGVALKQSDRAEERIHDHQQRLIRLTEKIARSENIKPKLRTAYITPGGVTAGKNTFINNIIKLSGLIPISEELGLIGWQTLPLEALIQNPPDLIIGSFFNQDNIHVSNWSLTHHNRIKEMLATIPTITVPGRYLSCNGIFSVDAAEYIHDAVETILK